MAIWDPGVIRTLGKKPYRFFLWLLTNCQFGKDIPSKQPKGSSKHHDKLSAGKIDCLCAVVAEYILSPLIGRMEQIWWPNCTCNITWRHQFGAWVHLGLLLKASPVWNCFFAHIQKLWSISGSLPIIAYKLDKCLLCIWMNPLPKWVKAERFKFSVVLWGMSMILGTLTRNIVSLLLPYWL